MSSWRQESKRDRCEPNESGTVVHSSCAFPRRNGGQRCTPPAVKVFLLLTGAFAGCLRLLHPFSHFGFHCVEIEACPFLHRWIIEERLEFLAHHLLDEHKTPELELEPIEVLLRSLFRPVVGPTLPLERIE